MVSDTCVAQAVFRLLHLGHQRTKEIEAHRQICPALIPQSSSEGGSSFVFMDAAQESCKEKGSLYGCWLLALYPI